MKIVIAEDDEVSRIVLQRTLEHLKFQVVALPDGVAAWDYLRENDASVLITDWMMPGLDGLELCRKLRVRGAEGPYTYVILLTARHSREERLEALRAGADDLLAKPLDRAELYARINVARRILSMEEQLRSRSAELERMHSELEQKNSWLAEVASRDGLTGLRNHRFFREALESQCSMSNRLGIALSLVMIDVDQFKSYNDSFGHPAGDQVLADVARLLRASVRDHDVVARYGGEEFAVLLPGTDEKSSRSLADRLRTSIERFPWPHRSVTISLGAATMDLRANQPTDLIEMADRSLYQSKAEGRNRVTHAHDLSTLLDRAAVVGSPLSVLGRRESQGHGPDPCGLLRGKRTAAATLNLKRSDSLSARGESVES